MRSIRALERLLPSCPSENYALFRALDRHDQRGRTPLARPMTDDQDILGHRSMTRADVAVG